jgi:hypothetical protein
MGLLVAFAHAQGAGLLSPGPCSLSVTSPVYHCYLAVNCTRFFHITMLHLDNIFLDAN